MSNSNYPMAASIKARNDCFDHAIQYEVKCFTSTRETPIVTLSRIAFPRESIDEQVGVGERI